MRIDIYTSCAGIAGDPYKLLVAETECGIRETELYNTWSWFKLDFYCAKRKLIKRIKDKVVII